MKKYHFIFDKTKKNEKFIKRILRKYKNYPVNLSNIIIVLGGDGFMLQALKKYRKYNKIFSNRNIYFHLSNSWWVDILFTFNQKIITCLS